MEAYPGFVKEIVAAFESKKLDYAFTGALAVSFYGVPRTTSDIDVKIKVAKGEDFKTRIFSALKEAGFKVDQRIIEAALTSGYEIATFKHEKAPYTLDVIFSKGKLDKKPGKIEGTATFFQSAEGLIAAKLRMIKATIPPERSAKDKEDIKAIFAFTNVDLKAVRGLARKDGTLDILETLVE